MIKSTESDAIGSSSPSPKKSARAELHVLEVEDTRIVVAAVAAADIEHHGVGIGFGQQLGEPWRIRVAQVPRCVRECRRIRCWNQLRHGLHDRLIAFGNGVDTVGDDHRPPTCPIAVGFVEDHTPSPGIVGSKVDALLSLSERDETRATPAVRPELHDHAWALDLTGETRTDRRAQHCVGQIDPITDHLGRSTDVDRPLCPTGGRPLISQILDVERRPVRPDDSDLAAGGAVEPGIDDRACSYGRRPKIEWTPAPRASEEIDEASLPCGS